MKLEYKQALFEVYVILENTDEEVKNKIPKKFIDFVKGNMDINHNFKLQQGKELEEQNLMLETNQILALIYRDYICTKEEREKLILQEKEKRIEKEEENKEKYKINFEKTRNIKNNTLQEKSDSLDEIALIMASQEKWYKKLIKKILTIFRIKNS